MGDTKNRKKADYFHSNIKTKSVSRVILLPPPHHNIRISIYKYLLITHNKDGQTSNPDQGLLKSS